jgi:hypothetical protein
MSQRRADAILIGLTLLVLVPFLNRAFNIDEPLFIWAAQHIREKPLDFYGFPVNWYATTMMMSDVMKNPPLTSYYIAAVGSLAGFAEPILHAAFLLPALAMVLGAYRLAAHFTARPLLAAILSVLSPVVVISATSVMCDVMMLALWIWALHLWMRGLRESRFAMLAAAAMLAGLAALTKYFGVCVIGLMIVDALLVRKGRLGLWPLALLVPLAVLGLYQLWTTHLYLRGLLTDALVYPNEFRHRAGTTHLVSVATGLAFAGGACIGMTPYLVAGASRRGWIVFASITVAIVALVAITDPFRQEHKFFVTPGGFQVGYFLQYAILASIGTAVLLVAVGELWGRWRDAESVVPALWLFGTFAFAALLNWSVNGRSILPMVPAAAILVCRRLDRCAPSVRSWELRWGLAPAAVLSLVCAASDASLAGMTRTAARQIAERAERYPGATLYINGKWGFQYYLQRAGGRPIEAGRKLVNLRRGDLVATSFNNTNLVQIVISPDGIEPLVHIEGLPFPFVTTMRIATHAGFYTDVFGPLPFVMSDAPKEEFELIMLTAVNLPPADAPP